MHWTWSSALVLVETTSLYHLFDWERTVLCVESSIKVNKSVLIKAEMKWIVIDCYSMKIFCFSSVQFSCSVVSDSSRPHESQHARPPYPSPTPGVHPNPCPSSRWCHPAISSSVVPFFSCPQSFPASGSSPLSQFFTSGHQSTGVSALSSVFPMDIQDWFLFVWTC